ncbi:MAG: 2-hydroxy-3-oxopropionate reductase [Deltaproteobacteria bacterium]|nr:2-hydroxy-3-oxopropionate reductase [Deltaproteobacteria bacterium]
MIRRIGFIGLGLMGRPMTKNLLKAGYDLTVYDINREAVKEVLGLGAKEASSPKEVAESVDAIMLSLPADSEVEEVILGKDGILDGGRPGSVLVDMSTISPLTAKRMAEVLEKQEMEMLDAPVSGGQEGAREASLTIMAGGKPEIFERIEPVLQKLGKNVTYIGGHGAGQVAKAANQIIVGLTIEAVAEGLVFAAKSGVDPEKVRKALLGGYAQSRVLELHGRRMTDRNFVPGGKVRSHKKDIEIVMSVARELGMYLPGTALLSHLWNAVASQGGLDWDHSSVIKVLEVMSQTEVKGE